MIKLYRYAIYGKDDKGSYIFLKCAKDSRTASRSIRDTGFQGYLDTSNPYAIDDIIDLDDTEVAR